MLPPPIWPLPGMAAVPGDGLIGINRHFHQGLASCESP